MKCMTRGMALTVLVVVGGASIALGAYQQQGQATRTVEVEKLRDNFFVLRGGGGNTGVLVAADGVVVVDTKNPGWGQPILDKIKELTPKPITTIINTHTHGDHVSGNVEFPATVDVVTHANTKANMEKAPPTGAQPSIFQRNGGRGLPKRTFTDRMTLGTGADRIELHYFGAGHTNGDAFVVFPALRIMHAGDIFSGKNLPLLDASNGGSGVQIGPSLAKAGALTGIDQVITGHSTVMTMADLQQYAEFNREFAAAMQAAKKAGKTVDEAVAGWTIPAKYTGYAAPQAARLRANVQVVYNETN
jgi:cyclase